jgi:hypothetical protein
MTDTPEQVPSIPTFAASQPRPGELEMTFVQARSLGAGLPGRGCR